MFTLKLLRNSLLCGVNSSRIAATRSIQLFKKPKEEKNKKEEEDEFEDLEVSEKFAFEEEESVDPELERQRIEKMRNKSGLRTAHRNMLFELKPYAQDESWIHKTLKYKRMMYGRYGEKSGIDPRLCFYTPTELELKEEYKRVAHPRSIQEMIAISDAEKKEKANNIRKREEQIALNLQKLEAWKSDFIIRKDKREGDARIAKERKDRLIEEVRRHFGYSVHPKDERFIELLEKKEKEQKKSLKEAKRQAKEAKAMERAVSSNKKTKTSENTKSAGDEDQ